MTQLVIFNARNHGLTRAEVLRVCEQIDGALCQAVDNPLAFMVVALWDFNYSFDSSLIFHRPRGATTQLTQDHGVHAPFWTSTSSKMMEVGSESPTHF
eukprot:3720636-Pyramimonas_sp.AAC.1